MRTAMILSSEQLMNERVELVVEKNGMSREKTLDQIVQHLGGLHGKGVAG